MENNNPVDQWTNAEIACWMAERDVTPEMAETWGGLDRAINAVIDHEGDPTDSIDAAVVWIERRGFEWTRISPRVSRGSVQVYKNSSYISEWATESPDCPTSRALCIASVKAQMEVEAKQ